MRRVVVVFALVAMLTSASDASAASWAQSQIRAAVESGFMGPSVSSFHPNDPLTRRALGRIVAGITRQAQVVVDPAEAVTLAELDRALVRALGLGPAAAHVRSELRTADLRPPRRAGTEVVARLLRLRYNHPAAKDALELLPRSTATRAEAAYSVARILELESWDVSSAHTGAMSFDVPKLTTWKRRVLRRAIRFVGYPYVWGGSSEGAQSLFGVSSRGGFDCSGFAWRVYKLEPWIGAPRLGTTIRGRTSYAMSGEIPRAKRIARSKLRPADLVFFGDNGPRSRPTQVGHMGIYVGKGWFVHSSSQGVTLVPLDGWYATSFAWGRRPLAEVGLS